MTSNLPAAPERGKFTIHVTREIEAPIDVVWWKILDFVSYREWNPFVRDMTIVSAVTKQKERDQTPGPGRYIRMACHIPPTMKKRRIVQRPFEMITCVDEGNHRVAWVNKDYPSWLFRAERWQALSNVEGKTLYETREVFAGPLAYFVKWLLGRWLRRSFEEMADGLKRVSETASKSGDTVEIG